MKFPKSVHSLVIMVILLLWALPVQMTLLIRQEKFPQSPFGEDMRCLRDSRGLFRSLLIVATGDKSSCSILRYDLGGKPQRQPGRTSKTRRERQMDPATAILIIFVGIIGILATFPRGRQFLKEWFQSWLRVVVILVLLCLY